LTHPLLSDPFVAAEIDRALQPYAAALAPEDLAWARDRLAELLEEDDAAHELLDAAYPRTVERSGEQVRPTATLQQPLAAREGAKGDGTGGGGR
jgi:hypothetical protein